MRVWSSNPLAFNCGAALYSLQRATEAAKPFPMWESSKQPVSSSAGGGGPGDPKSPERTLEGIIQQALSGRALQGISEEALASYLSKLYERDLRLISGQFPAIGSY